MKRIIMLSILVYCFMVTSAFAWGDDSAVAAASANVAVSSHLNVQTSQYQYQGQEAKISNTITQQPELLAAPEVYNAPGMFNYRGPYTPMFDQVKPWELQKDWTEEQINSYPYCNYFCGGKTSQGGLPNSNICNNPLKVVKKSTLPNVVTLYLERKDPLILWGTAGRMCLSVGAQEVIIDVMPSFENNASSFGMGTSIAGSVIDDNHGGSATIGAGIGFAKTRPDEFIRAYVKCYWKASANR